MQRIDESLYMRVERLQNGLLQFTDTTTAFRLMGKYGKDIRYIAPWKKWIVWDGKHWQIDDGCLIHDRGIKMVRAIYGELIKTADLRDQLEIE
jgi:putative DNA primase/helicase